MSYRKLSLIFITLLLASILLLQWWSIKSFTHSVSEQIGESAFEVSRATAEKLIFEQPKVQFQSFAFSTKVRRLNPHSINELLKSVKQDVFIQLVDKQEDDFILLNADGTEYEIPVPRTGINDALEKFSSNVLYSTLALLVIGVLLAIYVTKKLAAPLVQLQSASAKIGEGKFGTKVALNDQWQASEIKSTIDSFNHMSEQIVELQKQNESLQNKVHLAELTEIAKGLAHTIRNPLNTLNLAIDELKSSNNEEQTKNLTTIAKNQIKRIDKWVKSLMNVMSSDNNLIDLVNITQIFESITDDLKLANTKNIQIELEAPEKELIIKGIDSELRGLLQSIFDNSVEASPEQGIISVKLSHDESSVKIIISDQGEGFSSEILENMFSPHNTNKTYGAGMGLYLAHRVIKYKYQGELQVSNNNQDNGATVTLIINDRG